MTKRITLAVDDKIDHIKDVLENELGIEMSYPQVLGYLIKFYFKNQKAQTAWRGYAPSNPG